MRYFKSGYEELCAGVKSWPIVNQLGRLEFVRKSKRSKIGHWWSAINTGLLIALLGVVFGSLFQLPHEYFLAYLAAGLIIWFHIFAVLVGSTTLYPDNRELILQIALPHAIYPLQLWLREQIIFRYNLLLIPIVFVLVGMHVSWTVLFALAGLVLLELNLAWMIVVLSIISVRYRDVKQIVVNILQFGFYATPIIWDRQLLTLLHADYVLGLNPFFHLIEGVRAPLLGADLPWISFVVTAVMAGVGWIVALFLHGKFHRRIEYWV